MRYSPLRRAFFGRVCRPLTSSLLDVTGPGDTFVTVRGVSEGSPSF